MDARCIHNTAPIHNVPQLGSEAIHRPRQVDSNDPVPLLVPQVRRRGPPVLPPNNPRHVRRAVQPPVSLDYAVDPGIHLGPAGHVHPRDIVLHPAGEPREMRLGALHGLAVDVGDAHRRAAPAQQLRGGQADAARAAGDGVDFAGEGSRHVSCRTRGVVVCRVSRDYFLPLGALVRVF